MDFKKTNAPVSTVTRNLVDLSNDTGNIYESVVIIGKRSNQIAAEMKDELKRKLEEFGNANDEIQEEFHNEEQITVSKHYERLPKPTLIATQEFIEDKVFYRNPSKDIEEKL